MSKRRRKPTNRFGPPQKINTDKQNPGKRHDFVWKAVLSLTGVALPLLAFFSFGSIEAIRLGLIKALSDEITFSMAVGEYSDDNRKLRIAFSVNNLSDSPVTIHDAIFGDISGNEEKDKAVSALTEMTLDIQKEKNLWGQNRLVKPGENITMIFDSQFYLEPGDWMAIVEASVGRKRLPLHIRDPKNTNKSLQATP